MLVAGGDLGFPYLVLVVVVLFAPVIGFVIRRKWRRAAARAEEIRRLLVLASEDAARAELEASAGYSYSYSDYVAPAPAVVAAAPVSSSMPVSSLKPQYQCAVCFCPTTTRCAKCKAVRYCSGKCQIIHWRQGHKDECRPFVTIPYDDDVGGSSGAKVFNQDDNDNYVDGVQKAESVERSAKEPAFSHPSHIESLHQKNDEGFEYVSRGKGTNSSLKSTVRVAYEGSSASSVCSDSSVDVSASTSSVSDYSSGFSSVNLPANDFEAKTYSDHPSLVNCVDSLTGSGKLNHDEPYYNDGHSQSGKLGTPGRALDPYREPSFPDASTGSAGFWEGTIQSKRSRIDMLNDAGWPDSGEAASCNITDSQSSLSFSFERVKRAVPSINEQVSNANLMMSHVVAPTMLGIKKLTHEEATSLNELRKDATMRTPTSVIPEMSKQMDSKNGTFSRMSMSKEVKFVPSDSGATSARLGSAPGGHSTGEDAKTVRTLPPSNHDRLNSANNISSSSTSHVPKSLDVGSLSSNISNTHLSSCTRKCTALSVKSSKVDESREVAVCSSQLAERSQGSMNGLKTSMLKVVDQLKTPKLSRHHPLGAGSEMVALHGLKGLFSYELFVKLYNSKKVELLPCGLMNCGNSCYANAVLQCLAFTPPLTAYLLQGLHSKICEKKEWCFTCEFESLIRKAKEGNSPLSPIRILSQVQNIGSHFGNGREEDAHEFLRYAIDTMQSVCLKEAEVNGSGHAEEETTLVGLTFGGYLRSKIKCMKCGGKSERHERMMDLTVEIEGDIRTLEEALNKFTSTEILDGDNKYLCSRCKSYEKAKKKLSVLEAPNVLTIALKRFQLGKFGKLNKSIQFPEILDLAPYVSGTSDKSPVYRLYGMVVHVDIMNAAFSGHYVCYVKNVRNKWFMIDDSTVKEVELYNFLMKGAYMLLYARCSPRAPRAIGNSLIPRDPRKAKNTVIRSRSYSTESWDFSRTDHLYDHLSSQPFRRISDEDSSSDHSSSLFSESRSCSTESSNRDSSSTEEYFDHIFGDMERDWNSSPWRNSSDSDTSSSSSPSPLYSRHSPLADSNRYASGYHETIGSKMDHQAEYGVDGHGLWSRARSRSSKEVGSWESSSVLGSDKTKDCRKLGCSSSCREINSDRLGGWVNPLENVKSGVSFRRSTRGISD